MSLCDDLEELIPAYALGALDASERLFVEKHLRDCPDLRDQIASYENLAAQLAYAATPIEPRGELKYRVLAAAIPWASREPIPALSSIVTNAASWLSALFRSPAFAAATLVLMIALGIWNYSLQNQLSQQAALNQQMLGEISRQRGLVSAIAYTDSQPRRMQATEAAPQAVGRLYSATDLNTLAITVYDMPALEPKRVYQVWLIDASGDRTSGGTFKVDDQGLGWVLIHSPRPINQYQGIGITIEPEGGSLKPTGPKVLGTTL